MSIRVRFAPSPTGHLHIGGARSALFNYLLAKQKGGNSVLRIEDTDIERSKKEYEEAIFEAFDWLGIQFDEEPRKPGPYGPYRQSERGDYYERAISALISSGKAFYCPHPASEEEYAIHWCDARDQNEKRGIIRFKTPQNRDIGFDDAIRGKVTINTDTFGDFSVAKDAKTALYNLAVVVDDIEMKISNVFRGEDHIANTPKQILIYEALGAKLPNFAHQPLLLGPDRSKLSKRHGATAVVEFRERGYLPEALINFLALLGWNPGTEQEIFSLNELVREFSVEKMQKSGAIFDVTKLDWMNGEYIRKKSISELTNLLTPFIEKAGIASPQSSTKAGIDVSDTPREKLERIVALEQPRLKKLSEIGERIRFYFEAPQVPADLLAWKQMTQDEISTSLDESTDLVSSLSKWPEPKEAEAPLLDAATKRGDKGSLLWPLRAALTGLKASPGPFDVISILGKTESLARLKRAKEALK